MKKLYIDLKNTAADNSYHIIINDGLVAMAGAEIRPHLTNNRVIIISDENVAPLHLKTLQASLDNVNIHHKTHICPVGEQSKSFSYLQHLINDLFKHGIDRQTTLLAFGGGVVGDLTGFAAASILRGVPFIQIPTSLLAQVDSAVGGKTGINCEAGKNMVGAFYQPKLVLSDVNILKTLPARQLKAGYSEILKYALISDKNFFNWLLENGEKIISGDADACIQAVEVSCATKAAIVAEDEREKGVRALLNLGHTFAHSFEKAFDFSDKLLHGEAVGIGLNLAFKTAVKMNICGQNAATLLENHLKDLKILHSLKLLAPHSFTAQNLLDYMQYDKKNSDGKIVFILPHDIGNCHINKNVSPDMVKEILQQDMAG